MSKIKSLLEQAEQQAHSSESGASSVTSASRACSNPSEAETLFARLRKKLFRIEKWNAESGLSGFELFDENGNRRAEKVAARGNFIRISLAGSGKYDWVKIIEIQEDADEAVISVKPTYNPTEKAPDKSAVSHFFTDETINNFCLGKDGDTVSFYVIGLNEKTNTDETENFVETVRNFAASNIGYYFGIQKGEWKLFCENFLEIEK